MPTDVIISAFATPGGQTSRYRPFAQPVDLFKDKPLVIDVNGIGSDVFMGPSDTSRQPREPWGGAPFSREAAKYRDRSGSVLRNLIAQRARGVEVRRIALVGFSAGGTFLKNILESEIDRKMVDAAIYLDAINFAKTPSGVVPKASWLGTATFAAHAMYAGFKVRQMNDPRAGFLGPLFVTSHTHIKQSKSLEAQVANTSDSSLLAYGSAMSLLMSEPQFADIQGTNAVGSMQTDLSKLVSPPAGPFPLTIGSPQGVPAPNKTWDAMPQPQIPRALGNFYELDYGGTVAADHVFQAWYAQGAIWRTFLAPRWNAERVSPYSVAGLGDWAPCCVAPGGNPGGQLTRGFYPTGAPYWLGALGAAAGFLAGTALLQYSRR